MCFSIWYWMESNLSEMFPCVNSQTEAVSISWTGRRWNPSTKFIHFWSHGFYEAEGARRWFGNTAELLLGKTSRREVACCLLCFLGWGKRVAVTDVLQHWPSSGVFPLRSSEETCDFSPHFYWHYCEKLYLFLFTDSKIFVLEIRLCNTDPIMWNGRGF